MLEMRKTFPGKKPDDKIVIFAKKHWMKYALVISICLLLVIPIGILIFVLIINNLAIEAVYTEVLTLGISAYMLVALALIFHVFVDYYLDILIVTDDRIIYVRQNGYIFQQIDEIHLKDVQEVGVDLKGFWRSFFDYGNIIINSGSDVGVLSVDSLKEPHKIARKIMDLHQDHIAKPKEKKED